MTFPGTVSPAGESSRSGDRIHQEACGALLSRPSQACRLPEALPRPSTCRELTSKYLDIRKRIPRRTIEKDQTSQGMPARPSCSAASESHLIRQHLCEYFACRWSTTSGSGSRAIDFASCSRTLDEIDANCPIGTPEDDVRDGASTSATGVRVHSVSRRHRSSRA